MLQIIIPQIEHFLQLLRLFIIVLKRLWQRRFVNDPTHIQVICIVHMYFQAFCTWLEIVRKLIHYMGKSRKKKLLFKPHLLMEFLTGYR